MRDSLIFLLFTFLINSSYSQIENPENSTGNWLMYFGTHSINQKWSIHSELQMRLYEPFGNFNQMLPRVGLNYHIDKNSMVTAGYAWIPTQGTFNPNIIGGEKNIRLDKLVKLIEKITGLKSKIKLKPRIKLDPIKSLASNNEIKKYTGFKKSTSIEDGVKICVDSFKLNKF